MVYIEVARRAGLWLQGVNFPGHFLLRFQSRTATGGLGSELIVDPFHGGAILSETDCCNLLRKHVGQSAAFDKRLLVGATKTQILIRMLVNLKRIYVNMRSFPQGRAVTELLLALNPSAMAELRDRGLLAYHLNDFSGALRDLESYLRFTSRGEKGTPDEEHAEIWEHVKTLRVLRIYAPRVEARREERAWESSDIRFGRTLFHLPGRVQKGTLRRGGASFLDIEQSRAHPASR